MTNRKAIWVEKKWIDGKREVKVIVGTASGKRKGYERRTRRRKSEVIGQRRMKRWIKEEGRRQIEFVDHSSSEAAGRCRRPIGHNPNGMLYRPAMGPHLSADWVRPPPGRSIFIQTLS